jgi:hypothetical protein
MERNIAAHSYDDIDEHTSLELDNQLQSSNPHHDQLPENTEQHREEVAERPLHIRPLDQ